MNSIPAPQFTPRDEEQEWFSMTHNEILDAHYDVRGLTASFESLGLSVDETVVAALAELDSELAKMPDEGKSVFIEAEKRNPELVNSAHKTAFLWRDEFNPKLAARRLVNYWEHKLSVFGPEKCFLPLTLETMKEDIGALEYCLSSGFLRLLPVKDKSGRAILFKDPSCATNISSVYSNQSMIRACWYVLHVATEDPSVQELGLVKLVYTRNVRFGKINMNLARGVMSLINTYLPVRLRAFHLCQPHPLFHLTAPIFKFMMGKEIRSRFNVHHGTNEEVVRKLSTFGLPSDVVPCEMGGDFLFHPRKWLVRRRILERHLHLDLDQFDCSVPVSDTGQPGIAGQSSATEKIPMGVVDALQVGDSQPSRTAATDHLKHSPLPILPSPSDGDDGIDEVEIERVAKRMTSRETFNRNDSSDGDPENEDESMSNFSSRAPPCTMAPVGNVATPSASEAPNTSILPDAAGGQMATHAVPSFSRLLPTAKYADPRMNRAVLARLDNPMLSLKDALLIGGFSFRNIDCKWFCDKEIFDDDNVSLEQRKNQLGRRIRLIKKKQRSAAGSDGTNSK